MATVVKKSAKINFYKFVATPEPRSIRGAGKTIDYKGVNQLHSGINKSTQAINNLGATVNSIAKILQDFGSSQAVLLKNLQLSQVKFKPVYAVSKGAPDMGKLEEGDVPETQMPGFLESIFRLVKDFLTLAIGIPVMKWLADPANREKIKQTVETLLDFFNFVKDFISDRVVGLVDNLYELFRDDKTWFEKIPNIFGALVNFAGLFLAIRWLTNPMKLVSDFKSVLGLFRKGLVDSKTKLSRRAKGLGAVIAIGAGAYAISQASKSTSTPEMAKGGRLPQRRSGGFISGPQSGYPVSLDGGRSTSFIGHGLEYVARKASGGFVIPIDTPATRKDSRLMDRRISEALTGGYDIGGMFTPHRESAFKWGKDAFAQMAKGGEISLTSNGGGNKRMEPGKTYSWRELNPHHSDEGRDRIYNGINVGYPKDYGVGKLPQFMPSGPNGNIPTPVSGKVLEVGKISGSGYGKSVVLQTRLGNMHYAHLSKIGEGVKKGGTVTAGKIVGVQGGDGDSGPNSYAEHLHLNASPKGHEAFVNFITSGKPTTGRAGDSGSGGALALAPGKAAHQRVGNDKAFLKEVNRVAAKIKAHPADLLGMMASESGLNPAADNGTHVGLIQFSASSAASVGTTQAELKKMSRAEQMKYVEKYLVPKLKDVQGQVTAGHLYTAVFLPAFAGKPANFVVAAKDGSLPKGFSSASPKWYRSNKGLDGDGDGKITIGDLSQRVEKKKKEFGISGGGGAGDLSIEGEDGFDGDPQKMEPAIPEDPATAFQFLGDEMRKLFGGGEEPPKDGGATAASTPPKAEAGSKNAGDGKTTSPSSPSSGSGSATAKANTKPKQGPAAAINPADSSTQTVPGRPSPSSPTAVQPNGQPSSAQLVSQTTQTMQSRETVRVQQTTAIQQLQQVAAASTARTRQISQASAKEVAAAQTAANNQKPIVVGGGGNNKPNLLTQLNSNNNLLAKR